MENIRQEEIQCPDLEETYISSEEKELTALEIKLSSEIQDAYNADSEIQELIAERKKMLGYGKKNPSLIRNIEDNFRENSLKLERRMNEIQLNVIHKYKPDFQYPEEMNNTPPVDFAPSSLSQLLEKAMEDEKEQRELFPITSMYDLIKRIQKYYP